MLLKDICFINTHSSKVKKQKSKNGKYIYQSFLGEQWSCVDQKICNVGAAMWKFYSHFVISRRNNCLFNYKRDNTMKKLDNVII